MHGDQRRRAGRVDRHVRPLEPERVRQPTHDRAMRGAEERIRVDGLRVSHRASLVLAAADTHEHAGVRAHQRVGCDPRPFQGLPAGLEEQALLRIDAHCLTRRDPEETGVEPIDAVQEPTPTASSSSRQLRGRGRTRRRCPSARRELPSLHLDPPPTSSRTSQDPRSLPGTDTRSPRSRSPPRSIDEVAGLQRRTPSPSRRAPFRRGTWRWREGSGSRRRASQAECYPRVYRARCAAAPPSANRARAP